MMMILKKTDGVSRGAKFHGTRLRSVSILAQRLGTSGARDAFSAGPADLYHVVLALRTKPAMEGAVPAYGVRSQEGGLGTGQSHQRSYLRRAVGHAIGRRCKSHADSCSRAKPGGYTAAQRVLRGFQVGESNAVTCASALVPTQVRPSVKSNLRSLLPGMPGAAHQLLRTIQCRAGTPSRQPSDCCLFCVEPDGLRLGRGNLARRRRGPSSAGVSRPWVACSPQEIARISPYQLGRSLPAARLQPNRIVRTTSEAPRVLATHLRHSGCQPPLADRPRHADASARPGTGRRDSRHWPHGRRLSGTRRSAPALSRPIRHGCSTHAKTSERSWLLLIGFLLCLGSNVLNEIQMQDTAAKVSDVCVETTVVVDTLGPARR